MRDDHAKLNDLAEAELASLRAEGITPTDADIVKLNALGWAVEHPHSRIALARGNPVHVGGAVLWPLTLRGSDWLGRVGDTLVPGWLSRVGHPNIVKGIQAYAVAYAMAHGYSEGGELDADGEDAADAVVRWASGLRCTAGALMEAVEQVLDQDSGPDLPPNPDGKPMTQGDFSAFLAATCGATPEFWERRCAASYASSVLIQVARQNAVDGKPVAGDPRILAERALGWAAEQIRERARAE